MSKVKIVKITRENGQVEFQIKKESSVHTGMWLHIATRDTIEQARIVKEALLPNRIVEEEEVE